MEPWTILNTLADGIRATFVFVLLNKKQGDAAAAITCF